MTDQDPTLREMLDVIDQWLLSPEGIALWAVLTALRGPDANSNFPPSLELKGMTTNYIRTRAFPKTAKRAQTPFILSAIFAPSAQTTLATIPRREAFVSSQLEWALNHFYAHAVQAMRVLGFSGDEEHDEKGPDASHS